VLLAVLNGLAFSVLRELPEDLLPLGWIEIVPVGGQNMAPVAMPPTITEVSRDRSIPRNAAVRASDARVGGGVSRPKRARSVVCLTHGPSDSLTMRSTITSTVLISYGRIGRSTICRSSGRSYGKLAMLGGS
jgi:hypothetical protein